MPTPAQEAFAEGFADLTADHGTPWSFGGVVFTGVASALKPDDPRLLGSLDRLLEIVAITATAPALKKGDELLRDERYHRVVRVDPDSASGISSILITA